jgi:hypothetical protein
MITVLTAQEEHVTKSGVGHLDNEQAVRAAPFKPDTQAGELREVQFFERAGRVPLQTRAAC